ncbi:MAG: GAF domain-containing SpoIIE family protein phosphatase [Anaerolineales bacterium]
MAEDTLSQKVVYSELEQQLAQRDAELGILNSVQQALSSRLEVQAIYDLVGDKIREVFNAQVVMISTYDPQTDTIEHRYAIERGKRVYAPGRFPNRGFRMQIVQTRQPVLASSRVAEQAACLGQPTLPGTITPKTWLGVPMLVGDQVTGILSLQNVEQEYAFTDSDVRLLQTMAASLSVALENARLFDETQRLLKETEQRAAELQIINGVQEGPALKLDTASIYELVGDKIREIYLNADISIGIYDPAIDLLSVPYLVEKGLRREFTPFKVAGKGFIGDLLKNPHTLLINEKMEQAVTQYQSEDVTGAGLPKSAIYVPLTIGRSVRGEIVLADMQKEHAYNQADVRLLETLAASMSVALETARLWEQEKIYLMALEHEFEVGREIQAGFLPRVLPQPKGWEIAASLHPAREVAGDFYDVFELPGGKVGLVIADVCDKGLGAALFMTLFRSFIRSVSNIDFYACTSSGYGNTSGDRIMQAITLTNKYIVETHGDTGMFATIFFGIFDTHTGLLTYINGGHLPPRLINKNGIKHVLTLTGPAIGGRADADFILREVIIEPGETFFAYTDGLTDAENTAGETFSEQGLIPLFSLDRTLTSILAQIYKQLDTFSAGTQQIDDITMLAVRRGKK